MSSANPALPEVPREGAAPADHAVVTVDQAESAANRRETDRVFRHNAGWFSADYLLFGIGSALLNQSTVLPSFVSSLTSSPLLIGLPATIQTGGWLLPQLFAAGMVDGRPRKRPFMLRAAAIGRPAYLVVAPLVLLLGPAHPEALLAAFFIAMLVFCTSDGFVGVPWFDILSKTIPASRRGRLLGTAQIATGLVGVALGGVVAFVLGHPALVFPMNYAVLLALAGFAFVLDFGALAMLREPTALASDHRRSPTSFFRQLLPTLRGDPSFARVIAIRFAYGCCAMIYPFYIVFAGKSLGLGGEYVGLFLSAQVFGGVVGGLCFGTVSDRWGTLATIRLTVVAAALAPTLALLAQSGRSTLGPALVWVLAAAFVSIGVSFSGYLLGFMNYVLEIAPADQRPTYTGLFNTITGLQFVIPALAGWLLELTSYSMLFTVALVFVIGAGIATASLVEPRHRPR